MHVFNSIPTHMWLLSEFSALLYYGLHSYMLYITQDYDGQRRAEKLSRIIITLFGAVGLVWGYIIQQFSQTVYILGAGFVLAAIVTIPPWPMYRRKPLQWQKPRPENDVSEQPVKSKKKK